MEKLKDYTFKQFVDNCEVLRCQYEELLTPFFDVRVIECWRKMIYSLDMPEWRRDKIWEYLNGDETIETLKKLI